MQSCREISQEPKHFFEAFRLFIVIIEKVGCSRAWESDLWYIRKWIIGLQVTAHGQTFLNIARFYLNL